MLPLTLYEQLLIFLLTSLTLLFLLRRSARKTFAGRMGKGESGQSGPAEPGTRVVVVSDITPPAQGRVKYRSGIWPARSRSRLEMGEIAEIIEQDGDVMVVGPVDDGEL